jgi:two-component system, OmpR family, sensor kinase
MRRIRPLLPGGLQWRLMAWVAGVMLVSAAVVFVVVYQDTGSQLRGQIDRDLRSDAGQLAQSLRAQGSYRASDLKAAADRYISLQPYTATSTLLFALIPGAPTVSNHPEIFGAARPDPGETEAVQDSENRTGQRLLVTRLGYSTQGVPDVGHMRLFERRIALGTTTIVVGAGEPLALVERAQHGVARAFILAGAAALAIALLASFLAGACVSAPLRRMSSVAALVDAGDLAPRMDVRSARADEVRVLAEAFNHMLDRLAEAFAGQRAFVEDASHELRTPITVIRGQLEVLAAQENPSIEEVHRVERLVQREITRITRLVDDMLVLAQAERRDFLRVEAVDLRPFVADLWDGVSLTASRRFELGPIPDGRLDADPDRVAQALRNLARNAIEHTAEDSGLVRLEVDPLAPDKLRFAVLDDGPGIPSDERERVFERFHRTDRGRSRAQGGAGLGLAIVRAIAESHGGQVRAAERRNGDGARIELVLPGFRPV